MAHTSFANMSSDDTRRWTQPVATPIIACMDTIADIDIQTANAARTFMDRIATKFDLDGAIHFGSRARHNHRPDSDADIAVILDGRRGQFLDTKLAMADIAYDVLLETGVLVHPLPVWTDEWAHPEHYNNPALLLNIDREGLRL